ncbi:MULTISPECIES: SDR family NAD(P)-dependent oxidoreductase [unclassified Pseudofrankia]|uniref:SDR family NAD(P)-dependent oxidoreductase n=1 Tax=unclassified Pseudofrankia TaxID=2994372 RepID=UPI0008D91448|nr:MULTISPECIES: SDR family NAD(P)-dependent oxidoreductase [unclassified Pseudofrankia]MDT3440949.1 SDR family NAD(P)-dependent oxidoreductase [Pseudofrankia sp. BMG5.37]OHV45503.1 dehydrogenase [Pseudofrankia sp. BMG5.36]
MTSHEPASQASLRKIVLVTGANKGIGLATAAAVARQGHTVLLGARSPELGEAAAAALAQQGLDAAFLHLDVTDEATIAHAAAVIDARHGRLDILVNNAGITRDQGRTPSTLPVAALREVYETNVFGVVAVTNALIGLLRRSPGAVIGNVSSGLGTFAFLADPDPTLGRYAQLLGYNSSKAALNAITLIYAHELRPFGITVNALSPGYCATDLNGHTGWDSAEEGGARIAAQVLARHDEGSGVFLNENGGTYPW